MSWTLTLPSDGQPPRAIVLLIGWWGSKPNYLEKYSSTLYTDWNCATLSGTAHPSTILFKNDGALHKFAHEGLMAISDFLRNDSINNIPRIPVFVHLFSNGGGFVWEHMETLLHESAPDRLFESFSSFDSEDTPLHCNTNFYAIRRNLSGVIYDSCPCYPTLRSGKAALHGSLGVDTPVVVVWFLTFVMYVGFILERAFDCLRGRKQHRLQDWFQHLLDSDVCHQEAYIYSTADVVSEPAHLQDFIAVRKQRSHSTVEVLEFNDSSHVEHFRKHPDRYTDFIHNFITNCLKIHSDNG